MGLKVYAHEKRGTGRKALKYVDTRRARHTTEPNREQPATNELRSRGAMLLAPMAAVPKRASLALELLTRNGHLAKRTFVLADAGRRVGFDEIEWEK